MQGGKPNNVDRAAKIWLLLAIVFTLAPLIVIVIASFNSVSYNTFPPQGFSWRWYVNALSTVSFRRAFVNSTVVAFFSSIASVVIGTLGSIALVRYPFKGSEAIRALILSPIVVPKITLGVALLFLIARVKNLYGSLFSLVLAHIVVCLPFAITVISAALVNSDIRLEEAVVDLGGRWFSVFRHGILPQIETALIVATGFCFIISFDQVETSLFLVRPKNHTLPIEIFLYLERWQDPTIAALSVVLMSFVIGGIIIAWLLVNRNERLGMDYFREVAR